MAMIEPNCYEEASKQEVWVKAMEEEVKMIEKNNTWELVNCPQGKDIIGVKWVYKTKLNPDGTIQKHKARLVAKSTAQQKTKLQIFLQKHYQDQGLNYYALCLELLNLHQGGI